MSMASPPYPANRHGEWPWHEHLPGTLLRVFGLLLLLGALAYTHGSAWVAQLLPAFKTELNWLDDTYLIHALTIDQVGADQVVRIVVSQAHCIVLDGVAHCGDARGRAQASTLAGHVLVTGIGLCVLVLAWPARSWRSRLWRIALLPAALTLIWALDLPFVLWASIWRLHVEAFAPHIWSPLLAWCQFLETGGRMGLVFLGAGAVVGMAKRMDRQGARAGQVRPGINSAGAG